jgi:hypothetical protein
MHPQATSPMSLEGDPPSADSSDTLRLRAWGVLAAAPCLAVLLTAALLEPTSSGMGTHRSLGLSACSILMRTGYPCPSCGMTTAISAAAHGRLTDAAHAQLGGLLWFFGLVVVGAGGLAQTLTGRPALRRLRPGWWWAVAAVAAMLIGWAVKLAMMSQAGSLPVR